MKQGFKAIAVIVAIAFFGYVGYFYFSLASGQARLSEICAGFVPGMPQAEASSLARDKGLMPLRVTDGTAYLGEARTMGRFACRIEMKGGVVQKAEASFAD